ncbi:MAG: tocopherol cyclase family protein [Bacteroidota bacterium]
MIPFLHTLYHPEIFQGNLKKKHYFEGWYFKHVSVDLKSVYSFIPGIALAEERFAFIQVLNGITGESEFIRYPLEEFSFRKDKFWVKIGKSVFTPDFIDLNIDGRYKGRLDYSDRVPYPSRLLSPGIMDWYSFVPTMECKHGLVSMNHEIEGSLQTPSGVIDFSKGKGYIEKDWGTSFPESYLWAQCNNFGDPGNSFMLSVAKIPWKGTFFIGFLGFLHFAGKTEFFAIYNHSKIQKFQRMSPDTIQIELSKKNIVFSIEIKSKTSGTLFAPKLGLMKNLIKESIDSEIKLRLLKTGEGCLYEDCGQRAGLEVIEKIFSYKI